MMDSSIKSVDSSVDAIQENGDIFASINREAEQLKNIVGMLRIKKWQRKAAKL